VRYQAGGAAADLLRQERDPMTTAAHNRTVDQAPDIERLLVEHVQRGQVRIPPYPAVALRLGQIVRREDYGMDEIVEVLDADQALVSDVLRCANSAFYGAQRQIRTVHAAVTRIGALQVERLALASALAGTTRTAGPLQPLRQRAWQGAISSAMICQGLARLRGQTPEDSFLCGLLHDFGAMVGIACLEEILAGHPEQPPLPAVRWQSMIDRLHVELGLVMVERWKLPELFAEVISLHHEAVRSKSPNESKVEMVIASDQIMDLLNRLPSVIADDLAAVPMIARAEREPLARVLPQIPEMIASFENPGAPAAVPARIAPGSPLPEGFRPLSVPVSILHPVRRGAWRTVGIASRALLLSGQAPLQQNELIQLELGLPEPLQLWAKAESSAPSAEGFAIDCRPFALSGATQKRWNDVFRAAAPDPR
jgi:HD-like signal output (HDOD) protein